MKSALLTITIGILVLGNLGCDVTPDSPPTSIKRDSAGVTIVESEASGPHSMPWSLDPVPELSIGMIAGAPAYLLSGVVGGLRLQDGRIVIANGNNEVRFFDQEGRFLKTHGADLTNRLGNYSFLRGLARCGRSGIAGIDRDWQIHLYREDGSFLERLEPLTPDGRAPFELSCDEHPHVVALGVEGSPENTSPGELRQSHSHLWLMNLDGSVQTDFGEWLSSERVGTPMGPQPHPFGRGTVFSLHDDRLYVGSSERFEIEVRSLDGTLLRILRGPELDLTITDEVRREYEDVILEQTLPQFRSAAREGLAGLPWPDKGPAYTALRIDSSGLIWLQQRTPPGDAPETWSIMDPAEGYLGEFTLPNRARLLDLGADYLLVLFPSEFDVERVVLLSFDRGGTR